MRRRNALRLCLVVPFGAVVAGCRDGRAPGLDAGMGADAGEGGDAGDGGNGADGGGFDAGGDADAAVCEATTADGLGPFFEDGSPMRMMIAAPDEPGDRLLVEGVLLDAADCTRPLGGYVIDIWQADAEGRYHAASTSDYRLRGRMVTGPDGRFAIETIRPGHYETATGPRPAHLHARVYAPDGSDRLVTQLYFAGDPFLGPADGCQPPSCFSNDEARIMPVEPFLVGGRAGFRSAIRLVVPR